MNHYPVAVNSCKVYNDSLTELIYNQMKASGVTKEMLDGKKIAIKPNLVISKKPEIGATTQMLYDELTGLQWGKKPDPFGWVYPVN